MLNVLNEDAQIRSICCQGTESWSKHHADIANVNWKVEGVKDVVYDTAGSHKSGVDSATNDTP